MVKKKEIIIGVLIVLATIALALIPTISKQKDDSISSNEFKGYIYITITGEIVCDDVVLKVPYGSTYGDIVGYLRYYVNDYSILENDLTTQYFQDTIINIESRDNGNNANLESEKICINSANKDELIMLYGIGEKRAAAIIEYRDIKKIESFEELQKLIGVSDEIMERIKKQAIL